jgi:hypothetical protein
MPRHYHDITTHYHTLPHITTHYHDITTHNIAKCQLLLLYISTVRVFLVPVQEPGHVQSSHDLAEFAFVAFAPVY